MTISKVYDNMCSILHISYEILAPYEGPDGMLLDKNGKNAAVESN